MELCAGAGGQALGLELAGFQHAALVEIDKHCCNTLRVNRSDWNVIEQDLRDFDGASYAGVDLLAGGLPCPPLSARGSHSHGAVVAAVLDFETVCDGSSQDAASSLPRSGAARSGW